MTTLTIAILAGGKSSRMGQNKALLRIGEYPIIEHVIATATLLSPSELVIVTNTPQDYLHLGYRMETVLTLACDLPFVHPDLLKMLVDEFQKGDYQAVIPRVESYPQGVLAIYHQGCLPYFESAIQNDQRKLKMIFNQLERVAYLDESRWQSIDPQGRSFININTPDDLKSARSLWQDLN